MRNQYSISEGIKTIYYLLMTKLTMPQARLIRRPIYIRGANSLVGGKQLTLGRFCRFDLEGSKTTLFIGENCEFGDMTHIVAHERVEIGDHVLLASKVFISDTSHGDYKNREQDGPDMPPNKRKHVTRPVKIGANVWIGENVVILAGSSIGEGSIIGANSVVCKDVPERCIAVGVPVRVIKRYNPIKSIWECDEK